MNADDFDFFYDQHGERITIDQYLTLRMIDGYELVAHTRLTDADVRVSTVWLGMNHSIDGPPQIFETMVFGGELDGSQWRYETLDEATKAHKKIVSMAHMMERLAAMHGGETPECPGPAGDPQGAFSPQPDEG